MRLNIDRQNKLEPQRLNYAKEQLAKLGYVLTFETDTRLEFMFKGEKIQLFPYSGWHTGKTIKDGRGIEKLLKQLNNAKV